MTRRERLLIFLAMFLTPPFVAFCGWLNLRFYPNLPPLYVWSVCALVIVFIEALGIRALVKGRY